MIVPLRPQCLVGNKLMPDTFAVGPRFPRDAGECEAQQGATCGGEVPLTPDFLHPAAEEVLNVFENAPEGTVLSRLWGTNVKCETREATDRLSVKC